ncbi:MAG: hypothetical protein AB1353_05855 [Aquificota bacterium]|jgi:hypothetical protein|nr:hypothetical protein [Aquificaceae bacterium]
MWNTFSFWIRKNLKDAYSGLIAQDIDFVYIDCNKRYLFFIEEKNSRKARVGPAQKIIFKMFDDLLSSINSYRFLGTAILTILDEQITIEDVKKNIDAALKDKERYAIDTSLLEKLWDCQGKPPCNKTEQERSGYRGSILRKLFEKHKLFSVQNHRYIENINWIFLNYCEGYFIFIEEQVNGKLKLSQTRKEFIKIIDSLFELASNYNTSAKNPKSNKLYRYLGFYRLGFSNTNPDNSKYILLNNCFVNKHQLIDLLNLDSCKIEKYRIPVEEWIEEWG